MELILTDIIDFRITKSDMNCQRVKYVLRGIADNQNLETLDFSHCKIGDDGMSSLSKYLSRHENLRTLILTDNNFGTFLVYLKLFMC
jgi:Ran GTPase-activating protein (RanGAP) involved in mRNA processing and transport